MLVGILGGHIIGPLFIDENLSDAVYLEMLETVIDRLILEIVENVTNLTRKLVCNKMELLLILLLMLYCL